jgi:hypothetical protein
VIYSVCQLPHGTRSSKVLTDKSYLVKEKLVIF